MSNLRCSRSTRKAAEHCRTPRRWRAIENAILSARFWSAAVLCRFGFGGKCGKGLFLSYLWTRVLVFLCLSLLVPSLSGCVSKSNARAQARQAFIAGQQEAMARMARQPQQPSVTFIGPVKNPTVAWTQDLTLAKAILAAGYLGAKEPTQIMIVRNSQAIPIDPKRLLSGEDIPLASGDLVQLNQ